MVRAVKTKPHYDDSACIQEKQERDGESDRKETEGKGSEWGK